ncbi:MAG TPA: SLC13 family permease [Anaeromyxobacter sp.]|nr:SLC13 family permease [Anaeromyxobacter sp.]
MAAVIALAVVVVALVLFWKEWVPIEVTSLLVVFLLAVTGVLTPEEAFSGFSNDTVIFIFALLAMTQGLAATGVVRALAGRLGFLSRLGERAFIVAMMTIVATFSAFVSNTVTTAAFLPVVMSGAARARLPNRHVLMPLSFASMLGGTIVLFGTSTNLVMSEVMERAGLGAIRVFELAPAGLAITILGIAVVGLFGPRLLRRGEAAADEAALPERAYLAEIAVPHGSPHVGRPVHEFAHALGADPIGVVRGERAVASAKEVRPEDRVVVEGPPEKIVEAADAHGVAVPDAEAAGPARDGSEAAVLVVEAAVPPDSRLVGRTMGEARLAERLGVELLAIHRRPAAHRATRRALLWRGRRAPSIATLPISVGDVLLLRAPADRVRELASAGVLLVLTGFEHDPPRRGKAALAVALFVGALALGTAEVLPMSVAGLAGLLAMVLTGCVDGQRALRIDWRVVLLIGSMLALGLAMERSGAGKLVGEVVARAAAFGGPRTVMVLLAVITILLSAPMSNQAASLVVFPVALAAAHRLGIDPRPLAIAVTLAGSCSFMTPLEPSAMLVYGAGRYRFADFVRTGAPVTAAVVIVIAVLVPIVWPLG